MRVTWVVTTLRALLVLALAAAAPMAHGQVDPGGGVGGGTLGGTLTVTVIDALSGDPIPGAFCQVGTSPGSPFAGNLKFTNALGNVVFTNAALTGPQTVTVGKDGYTYLTLFGVNAAQMILPINLKGAQVAKALYDGDITGFTISNFDGFLDIAVTLPTVSVADVTSLANFGQFAPIVAEDFPGAPNTPVPGNLYMPSQNIFLFFPIERTPYYLWLEDQTVEDVFAFYGRVPDSTLIRVFTSPDPSFLAIAQSFEMRRVGIVEGIAVNGPDEQNFALTNNVTANFRIRVQNSPAGTDVFLFCAADLDGMSGLGRIVPCGIEGVTGGTNTVATLTTINPGGAFVGMDYLGGAVASDTSLGLANTFVVDRSGLAPGDTAQATTFFRAPTPSVAGPTLSWTSVTNPGISPAPNLYLADIVLTKTIQDTNPGGAEDDTLDISTPLWQFYVNGATTSLTIPTIGPNVSPGIVDPATTADQDRLDWTILGAALTLPPAFNYNDWDFEDRALKGTHLSWNSQTFIPFPSALYTGVGSASPAAGMPSLADAAPNPFRRETSLAFSLPAAADPVRLEVFDVSGRRVRRLIDGARPAGAGSVVWDGRDDAGRAVAPGSYLLRLESGAHTAARKVTRMP